MTIGAGEAMIDTVRALLAGGESYYAEFKTAWDYGPEGKKPRDLKEVANDIAEALVAFANSDGGDLLVGVEDSGHVTGLPWSDDRLLYLQNSTRTHIKGSALGAKVYDLVVEGHRLLLFRVEESTNEVLVTSSGRCLWRRGASSEPVPPAEIERRRRHRLGDAAYEAAPVPDATLEDLALPSPDTLARRNHLSHFKDSLSLLRYWNLVDSKNGHFVLRKAALLLFAKEPLRWHANNRVRLRRVSSGVERFGRHLGTSEREVLGPITHILAEASFRLRASLRTESRQHEVFNVSQLLPAEAVDECLVNAVAHRNYAIEGLSIEVVFFPDRVEFRSPGRLPEPLTLDDLRARRGVHRSRNPIIMRVLRDLGHTRDQGEGMKRIFGAMSQVELHEPELEELADTFVVRLSTRSLYDESTQAWLAAYGPFGLEPHERKYLVVLRNNGGVLSTDKIARELGEAFDIAKTRLSQLERKGFLGKRSKGRRYFLIPPLQVPHERALRRFEERGIQIDPAVVIGTADLPLGSDVDERSRKAAIDNLVESGILVPAGKQKWKFGTSLLTYARQRADRAK